MLTPAYGLTATERVLPSFVLDWTTGLTQDAVDVTRAGVATFVGSNGWIQSAAENTQRIDYRTGVAGLLVEESRTNLQPYSADFNSWVKVNSTISSNAVLAPDGTSPADKFIVDDGIGSNSALVRWDISKSAVATTYTISVYAEADEVNSIRFLPRDAASATNNASAYFNLATGQVAGSVTASGTFTNATAKIELFKNGIYRCSITFTSGTETSLRSQIFAFNNGTSIFTGNGSDGIYIWGAQLEAGAFPTSYIPTEASAVTRNADVATVTDLSFFNASEGTFYVESDASALVAGSVARVYLNVSQGLTAAESMRVEYITTTSARFAVTAGGSTQAALTRAKSNGGMNKVCAAYKVDDFLLACNASAVATDTSGSVPSGVDYFRIGSRYDSAAASWLNGHISKIMYWPYRLTPAEVQAFSK